jgi:hypothetical protein
MRAVGYAPWGGAELLGAGADEVLSSLLELPGRLGLAPI